MFRMNKFRYLKVIDIVLFIAIFGSSIIAAKIGGVSISKICLIPLFIFLMRNDFSMKINKNNIILILFYFSMGISCIIAMLRTNQLSIMNGYYSTLINYLFQIVVFYLPLIFLVDSEKIGALVASRFEDVLICVVRIHCFWSILQEIFYIGFKISINDLVFIKFLGGLGLGSWTSYCLFANNLVIRVSGINVDPAYLGILLILGFIFDKKVTYKYLYVIIGLLTFSRTTIVGISIAVLMYFFYNKKITLKKMVTIIVFFIVSVIILMNPKFSQIFHKLISRFDFINSDISKWSVSSYSHIMYYPYAILVWIRAGFLQKLFGVGPRIDGIAFNQYDDIKKGLRLLGARLTDVWCAESDFVGMLLGCGIIGLVLYYMVLIGYIKRSSDYSYKIFFVCLLITGIMYSYYSLTIVNLCLICFQPIILRKNKLITEQEVEK